ncbi:T9SS type A sorting domain-containing protein [Neolewinella lacunae]|uniref:T9SS type A sorting domain-containing protein n=1 Tax=Neolewinella lacunae TaxID=1517758 RepID=A0A923PLL4_9BACT|nr:T9SS type A sorting domain-containing protein [Neolewinella lacunae]MBC6994971.1 T9SS type A sorting domain-containing protein [Neolewinella lacunae]MDN3633258.1 T9SS type A sorting domain-containing protein [Neolewinella lacunae]
MLRAPQLAADDLGYTYSCGYSSRGEFYDLLFVGNDRLAVGNDNSQYFVAQTDRRGNPRWLKRFSGLQSSSYASNSPMRILPNAGGGVKIVSRVNADVVYGRDTLASLGDSRHILLADIDTLGNVVQSHIINTEIQELTVAKSATVGDVLLAGTFTGGFCRVGSETLTSNVSPSYFVARIGGDGQVKWLQKITPKPEWLSALRIHGMVETSRGEVVVATNPMWINARFIGPCPQEPRYVTLNALRGSTGETLWQQDLLSATSGLVTDIKEVANGDLLLTGAYAGELWANNGQTAPAPSLSNCNFLSGFRVRVSPQGDVLKLVANPVGMIPQKIEILANGAYATLDTRRYDRDPTIDPVAFFSGTVLSIFSPTDQLLSMQGLTETFDNDPIVDMVQHEGNLLVAGNYRGTLAGTPIVTHNHFTDQFIFMAKFNVASLTTFPERAPIQRADVLLFPNPASDVLNVAVRDNFFEATEVRIYDLAGQMVKVIPEVAGRSQFSIAVDQLVPGVYLLQIGPKSSKDFFRFIKQ